MEDFVVQEEPFLHQVYSPTKPETPNIDLVFVHGLNPFGHKDHAFRTWTDTSGKNKILWPQKFLPQDFPKARIWIFGYNSNVSRDVSEAKISDHANSLLDVLQWERQRDQEHSRIPIIFLGHSLGGLVIKQALLNAKENHNFNPTWEAAFGLVFFGTPHRGGNTGGAAALAARAARLYANDSADNNLLMCLKPDSLFTQESSERFSEQLGRYSILTFFETKSMKFHGINKIVVNRHSAILSAPRERKVALNRDHRGICKFADRGNAYNTILRNLIQLVGEALGLGGNSNSSNDTAGTSTPTLVSMTQQPSDRTSSFETDERLSTGAQSPRRSHEVVISPSNPEETVNQEGALQPRRSLQPESQNVSTRSIAMIASSQVNSQMTGQENIERYNTTSSSQHYTLPTPVSKLNDQFLRAVEELDTPLIHNWINDPIRRPKIHTEHIHAALLNLAGFKEGKKPDYRTHAVSVILNECDPDLECRDKVHKATPLILAASGGREAIVLLLINKGASLRATDAIYGRTALIWAARNNAFVTAEILLSAQEKDPDQQTIHFRDKDGLTALDLASQRKHERMIRLLKSHGAGDNLELQDTP